MIKSIAKNIIQLSTIIFILLVCQGCLFYLIIPQAHNEIMSYCVADNEMRIIFERVQYRELTWEGHKLNFEDRLFEFRLDISELENNDIDFIDREKILNINKPGNVMGGYVKDCYYLMVINYIDSEKGKYERDSGIYDIENNKLVKIVGSDGLYFTQKSYNYSKIYYFLLEELHLLDVNTMADEVLPHSAYEFLKTNQDKNIKATDTKFIFSFESNKEEYILINIVNGESICKFNINHGEHLYNLVSNGGQWIILTGDYRNNVYDVRNGSGQIFNHLDFHDYSTKWHDYFIDAKNSHIYFLRYDRTSQNEVFGYGYIDIVRWNYVTNEVIKIKYNL